MTYSQKVYWFLTYTFLICGFGLVMGGVEMMPDNMPANELNTWLQPGALTAIVGIVSLVMSLFTLANTRD